MYYGDRRREQLGVSISSEFAEGTPGELTWIRGWPFFGYTAGKPRPVADYLYGAHILGLKVLRPRDPAADERAREERFLAAHARRPPPVVDGEIVDSAMTPGEAILDHLPAGCPRALAERQALVDVDYYSFDGKLHRGQIVVDRELAGDVRAAFALLAAERFPVQSVIPISAFGWDDERSMQANNTSGFNYRDVTGSRVLSNHACGFAFDLNPRLNPYVREDVVQPAGAVHDATRPGTLTGDAEVTGRLKALGWRWGGDYRDLKDWQHFERGTCRRR